MSYFDTILIKDVAGRYKIRDLEKLRFLAKFYLTSIASPITYNNISKATKGQGNKGLSVKTIQRFSEYLSSTSLLFFVKRFSFSIKEQENSQRKVYAIDNGFSTVLGFNFMEIKGRLMENAVATELFRRARADKKAEFYYWKSQTSGKEVDFIVKTGVRTIAIQAAYSIENAATRDRELDALIECTHNLGLKEGTVITRDKEGTEEVKGIVVKYVSLRNWLLGIHGRTA
jgi:predicted AAA+ superfamily ATPase